MSATTRVPEKRVQIETSDGVFQIAESEARKYKSHYSTLFSIIIYNLENYKERINTILFDYDNDLHGYNIMAYTTRGTLFPGDMPLSEDHSNDLEVVYRFIKRWNSLDKVESTKEQTKIIWNNQKIMFNKEWGGHVFTDDEIKRLADGEDIVITCVNPNGEEYESVGKFGQGMYNGFKYWGFIPYEIDKRPVALLPTYFRNHKFTPEEKYELLKGKSIIIDDLISQKTGRPYSMKLTFSRNKDVGLQSQFA